jgi:hypothetical protein
VHRALLGYLCDEALDCEALRGALAARLDAADGVKQELRKAVAGDRGKLKVPAARRQDARCVCAVRNARSPETRLAVVPLLLGRSALRSSCSPR